MKEKEEFHHTGFPGTELQYGLISATGLTGAIFLLIQEFIDIPYNWLPTLGGITAIILTVIITWLFKQISNRERIILDEVGITMIPKFGKPQNYDWERVSHFVLAKENVYLESRVYLTDGNYFTFNIVRFPPMKVKGRSKLLSTIMDNELEIIDYNTLEDMQFGNAIQSFAPQVMAQTKVISEEESSKL